jgi:hypothetical protein
MSTVNFHAPAIETINAIPTAMNPMSLGSIH